jgi:fructokinase
MMGREEENPKAQHPTPNASQSPEVVRLGEALIDFIALETGVSLIEASGFRKAPGGAPANVAAGVAKLGASGAFVGKVGDDPFGRFLARTFADCGVDVSRMIFDKGHRTGLAFVSLTAQAVPDFLFYRNPSADMLLEPAEIDSGFISDAKIFHYGSISLISEPSRSATLAAAKLARDAGAIVSYDPNLRPSLWKDAATAKEGMIEGLEGANVVKMSEEELRIITGDSDLVDGLRSVIATHQSIDLAFVTTGPEGCWWATALHYGTNPGFNVEPIDTTGAGDAFVAAVLYQLLRRNIVVSDLQHLDQSDLWDICRFANAAGALATTKRGAIPSLPTVRELQEFLGSQS